MKKWMLMLLTGVFINLTFAQKIKTNKMPEVISAAFQKRFPGASEIKWEKENDNYEVEFDLNETEYSAIFDVTGNLLEYETEIQSNQLPKGALDYLKINFPGEKIKEASKIISADGTITFEAELKRKDILFDHEGKLIRVSDE